MSEQPHSPPRGSRIGEYEVVSGIGEGAMGVVVSAVHPVIGKRVAIKILKQEAAAHDDAVDRFIREARAVNAIEHPNIIDVFSFGTLEDGRCYYVMEHLDGESLDDRIERAGPLTLGEVLPILRQVASAVDAAHACGVIHRDLKPDNIFLSRTSGGELVVKVLDFGIAKLATEQVSSTQNGVIMGTPLVMSPEQCLGVDVDHRTDLYALGVVAYRALTGRYPFSGHSVQAIIFQQLASRPTPLRLTGAPDSLEPIIARALAKHPGQRFQSAGDLIAALDAASSSVQDALAPAAGGARQRPAGAASPPVLGSALGPVDVPWDESTGMSDVSRDLARARSRKTVEIAAASGPAGSQRIGAHTCAVRAVAFSPDGMLIASAGTDGTVRLHGVDGRQLAVLTGHTGEVEHVAFSPHGHLLASGGTDGRVRLWSIFESRPIRVLRDHRGPITALRFSARGDRIVSASADATVRVWDVSTGMCTTLRGHTDIVRALACCSQTGAIASASDDRTVRVWDDASGSRRVLSGHRRAVYAVEFSPDALHVAAAGHDGTVREWRLTDGTSRLFDGHGGIVWDVAYSPDGQRLASAGSDGLIRVWNRTGGEPLLLRGHEKRVRSVVFSADGKLLASVSADGTVRIWEVERRECLTIVSHSAAARSAVFSPDGRLLLTAGGTRSIYLVPVTRSESAPAEESAPPAAPEQRAASVDRPMTFPSRAHRRPGRLEIAAVGAVGCAIIAIVIALVVA